MPFSFLTKAGNPLTQLPTLNLPRAVSSQEVRDDYTRLDNAEAQYGMIDLPLNAEDDDALHRPGSEEDDDGVLVEQCLDLCRLKAMFNLCGLMMMTLLVLAIFIGLPIVAYLRRAAVQG